MKEYIERIVNSGNQNDMNCLSDMLVDLMYELKNYDYPEYSKKKNILKGMAYNYQIDEELAKEIVDEMKPLGEYWSVETISTLPASNHNLNDMYVVMNSLANDYSNVINLDETETYFKMANAWLDDVDGKEHKVWWYFVK